MFISVTSVKHLWAASTDLLSRARWEAILSDTMNGFREIFKRCLEVFSEMLWSACKVHYSTWGELRGEIRYTQVMTPEPMCISVSRHEVAYKIWSHSNKTNQQRGSG